MRQATHREIEVKLAVADLPALLGRLENLGAVPHGRVLEQNTLYDTANSDLRRTGRLLRLRIETSAGSAISTAASRRSLITSKAPPDHRIGARARYKERLERERIVAQAQGWPALLRSIGFQPRFRYEKFRTAFRLQGLQIDLDETPVGTFLELEGREELIDRVARRLGFQPSDYLRTTYWGIYRADCRRRGVAPKNMVFDRKKIPESALFA